MSTVIPFVGNCNLAPLTFWTLDLRPLDCGRLLFSAILRATPSLAAPDHQTRPEGEDQTTGGGGGGSGLAPRDYATPDVNSGGLTVSS